ncbi:hypothetical protein LEMLEM_LOCUS14676 [Lemmus lemmus]
MLKDKKRMGRGGQHPYPRSSVPITSRGRWASKRLLMEFARHLGKTLLLPGLLNWTCMTCREMTAELA